MILDGLVIKLITFLEIHRISYSAGHSSASSMSATAAGSSSSIHNAITCTRLYTVLGNPERRNDVVFCGNRFKKPESNVIFFGGDVQDYSENMLAHRDNKRYENRNLESTAKQLQLRFPNSHIWVMRPSKLHMKTFSVYSNFVNSDSIGSPTYSSRHGAWTHLSRLLGNASKQINSVEGSIGSCQKSDKPSSTSSSCNHENGSETFSTTPNLPLTLIGFSKGGVVLNQLIHELKHAKENPNLIGFIKRIADVVYLDSGHNGEAEVWITDPEVLKNLVDTSIEIKVHVTPYQVKDPMRKRIGVQHKKFINNLRKLGISVSDTLHFADEDRSLENHFRILERF